MIRSAPAPRRLALVLGLAVGFLAGAPLASAGAEESAKLVEDANRKVRQHDLSAAIKLLELAIASDPANTLAHIRYQDLARDALGVNALVAKYGEAAKAKPDDPVAQFLATRLLPPAEAASAFEKQAAQFKTSPWPCAGRARAQEDLGRFNEAVATHSEAVTRAGADAPRFLAYRAYGYERGQQWPLAVEAWKAVLAKVPGDLAAHLGLAEALRKNAQFDEALAALETAGKVGATEPEIAYRRGLVHVDAESWDKAIEAFEAALALDRGMLEALCAACDAAVKQAWAKAESEKREVTEKDLEKATGYGDRAVVGFPESPYAHFVLAAAHEAAGLVNPEHYDTALQEYQAAIDRLPIPGRDKVNALTAKSYILLEKEQFEGAIEAAQRAIDIDKNCVTAYGHAAFALSAQGKPQDAISKFLKPGLKVDPKNARLNHDLGVALWELKKPNDARKPLEDARSADPKNGRYRLTLGELYYELKRYKEAVAELFEATELLPRAIEAWSAYGRACYSAKSWDECVKAYEKVCEMEPKSVAEHLYLAAVYADQKKDKEKAKEHILKFRENGGSDPNLDDWMNQILGTDPAAGGGNKP